MQYYLGTKSSLEISNSNFTKFFFFFLGGVNKDRNILKFRLLNQFCFLNCKISIGEVRSCRFLSETKLSASDVSEKKCFRIVCF